MTSSKKNRNKGAATLFFFFGLLFFVLAVRFFTIQFTGEAEGKVLAAKASKLYMRTDVLKAERGTIYDRKGEVIAEDSASYTLIAILDEKVTSDPKHPNHVADPAKTAAELSKYIKLSEQKIYELLSKEGRFQVEFGSAGRDLPHNVKKKIEDLDLPGISFIKESKRFYPNGIFASHLIGYAQRQQVENKPAEIVGKTGLEKSYDELLKGKDGKIRYEGDFWNYILPNSKTHIDEPENGMDIYLTIDKKIQTFLEDAMNKVDEEYSPKRILAIVADPKTGKILAMGQRPTFHPVTREGIEKTWHNEVVESTFEPGSTMKIFSLAAAVEEGAFNPNDSFPSGRYCVNQKDCINDHKIGGWGTISYLEGVQRSSNVGFAYLLEKMGTEKWREYMDKFKFGTQTGIDLPNEAAGSVLYDWPIEKVTSVYGQGTTVTALQMVQAMTAIANGGKMMKPFVVDKTINPNDGTEKVTEPEVAGQPVSPETARKVRDYLETVITSPKGTGKAYHLDGYSVSGKTGTAQLPGSDGKYISGWDNYLFSFLGMAPKDDPKLVMYVAVQQPDLDDEKYENGAVPVSMIFNPVMKNSLQYLNIEPEELKEAVITKLPDMSGKSTGEAVRFLEKRGLIPTVIGSGNHVAGQSPLTGSSVIEGERVILRTEGPLTVPDMTGWSKRDVLKVAQLGNLKVNMTGDGFAVKQNLKSNSPLKEGDHLAIHFEKPLETMERVKAEEENTEGETPPLD